MANTKKTDKPKAAPAVEPQGTQEAPAPVVDPQEVPQLEEDTVAANYPGGLNLRDGPGLSFHVLGQAPDGAKLTVLQLPEGAEVPGFALVRYEGSEDGPLVGWVNTDFVRED